MSEMMSVEEVADAMYKMVKEAMGMKKLKPTDLTKAMIHMYEDKVDKKLCKEAIKELVNNGRCVYTYFGGSFIEIPHKEGADNE
jgi:3-oxoacyl-[acyl-carrier-protein] synthase III